MFCRRLSCRRYGESRCRGVGFAQAIPLGLAITEVAVRAIYAADVPVSGALVLKSHYTRVDSLIGMRFSCSETHCGGLCCERAASSSVGRWIAPALCVLASIKIAARYTKNSTDIMLSRRYPQSCLLIRAQSSVRAKGCDFRRAWRSLAARSGLRVQAVRSTASV
jgi:hypothetical protein